MLVGVFLDRETILVEERKVLNMRGGLVEIYQDADAAALGWLEDRVQQADDIELGKLAFLGV
jgi:hypothetical protein